MPYTASTVVWEFIFMMLVLKIPIVYLGLVVYWAVKSEPRPPEPALLAAVLEPEPRPPWRRPDHPRRPRPGPHGSPVRSFARTSRAALPS
jgi:hypothetical protein